jgi:integrase
LELVTRNVRDMVSPPCKNHKELEVLTDEQARRFLEVVVGQPDEALFTVAPATGMRRGELLVMWQDIDFEERILRVSYS